MKFFLTETVKMDESARIMGLALTPQISRNGTLYTVGQLKHGDGVAVPLNIEHNGHPLFGDRVIGEAVFSYDAEMEQLNYIATITDDAAVEWAQERILHVSIEAEGTGSERVCNTNHDCFDMPRGLKFTALALTETPGIPQSTVSFLESTKSSGSTYIPLTITGGMATESGAKSTPAGMVYIESLDIYVRETKLKSFLETLGTNLRDAERKRLEKLAENTADVSADKSAQVATDSASECGEGMQKDNDGNCVPTDNQGVSEKKKENDDDKDDKDEDDDDDDKKDEKKERKRENDDDDDKDDKEEKKESTWIPNMDDITKAVKEAVADATSKIDVKQEVHKHLYHNEEAFPVVNMAGNSFNRIYSEARGALDRIGRYKFGITMDNKVMERYGGRASASIGGDFKLKEAVTFAGGTDQNIAGQRVHADSRVIVDPAGLQTSSIRDLVRFTEVAVGDTEVVFQITDAIEGREVTEGSANMNQTDTFNNVILKDFPSFGHTQSITRSTFENSYTGTLDAIAEKAAIASVHREAQVVFRDLTNAATPANWLNATGGSITTDDTASSLGTLNAEVIGDAETLLRERGYATNGEEICIAVTPKQLNDLRNDGDIIRWMQYSKDGERLTQGVVPMIHGVRVVPMLAMGQVNTGNNIKERAVVFLKNYSFILGAKRELQISMLDNPNRFSLDWSWSKRVAARIYKNESIVRISTDGRT